MSTDAPGKHHGRCSKKCEHKKLEYIYLSGFFEYSAMHKSKSSFNIILETFAYLICC